MRNRIFNAIAAPSTSFQLSAVSHQQREEVKADS
jgi:hypothetical protein